MGPGLVWTDGKSRPTGIRSPDRPTPSQSLYRLSYLARFKLPVSPFNVSARTGDPVPSKANKQKYLQGVMTGNNEVK